MSILHIQLMSEEMEKSINNQKEIEQCFLKLIQIV